MQTTDADLQAALDIANEACRNMDGELDPRPIARLVEQRRELLGVLKAYLTWGNSTPAQFEAAYPELAQRDGTGGVAAIDGLARAVIAKAEAA